MAATIDKYSYALLSPTDADSVQIGTSEYPGLRDLGRSATPLDGHPAPLVLEHFGIHRGASVFLTSELPPHAGIGTYTSETVALIRAALQFSGEALSTEEIAELACSIEIHGMRSPIGKQDAYAAAFGGINYFEFDSEGVRQEALQLAESVRRGFEARLMLFFTGRSRKADYGLAEYKRSMERNRATVVSALHVIKRAATELRRALELGDLDDVGPLLDRGWSASRQLGRGIGDAWMEQWYEMARWAGADGGGTAGFGGTGFLFLYCLPERQRKVEEALDTAGLKRVEFRLADEGVALILDEQTRRPVFHQDVPLVGVRSRRAQH